MVKKNLALISNEHLQQYIINNGQDNALTFAMRVGNFGVFKFLLSKGVSVLAANPLDIGMTAVHAAIEMQKLEYLAYLFEGDSVDVSEYSALVFNASRECGGGLKNEKVDSSYISKLSNKPHIW